MAFTYREIYKEETSLLLLHQLIVISILIFRHSKDLINLPRIYIVTAMNLYCKQIYIPTYINITKQFKAHSVSLCIWFSKACPLSMVSLDCAHGARSPNFDQIVYPKCSNGIPWLPTLTYNRACRNFNESRLWWKITLVKLLLL